MWSEYRVGLSRFGFWRRGSSRRLTASLRSDGKHNVADAETKTSQITYPHNRYTVCSGAPIISTKWAYRDYLYLS